jgi:D-glycero-alpha-D-manno-heptose 1-phosphate guanylyltransferase
LLEVIVLAGGLGTRLRSVVNDRPKPMCDIAGKPFLEWLLSVIVKQGVEHIILSVGYQHEKIEQYFGSDFRGCPITYSIESFPLGTGGAIRQSLKFSHSDSPFVINGDSFSWYPLQALRLSLGVNTDVAMAVLWLTAPDRYSVVELDSVSRTIVGFKAKGVERTGGYINSGTYCLNKKAFLDSTSEGVFSMESDFFETRVKLGRFSAVVIDSPFIDVGIPEDYQRAQHYIPNSFVNSKID